VTAKLKRKAPKEPRECLRVVQTSMGFVEAEIIRSYLESNGIKTVFQGTGAQSILPQTTDGMGKIEVCVLERDLPLARQLLKEFDRNLK
jgi:hypothetical protein